LVRFYGLVTIPPTELIVTNTTVPESTKTSVPPTATEAPLINIPKETATIENGMVYTWVEEKDSEGNLLFEGNVAQKTIGLGIPIADFVDGNEYGLQDFGFIQLSVTEKSLGNENMPRFSHTAQSPEHINDVTITGISPGSLYKRITGKRAGGAEYGEFLNKVGKGEISLDFYILDPDQKSYWFVSPTNGANIYVTDWESMEGSYENTDASQGNKIHFRSKILGVNAQGELIAQISILEPLDTLTPFQYNELLFMQVAGIFDHADQTKPGLSSTLFDWLAFLDNKSPIDNESWVKIEPLK